MMMKEQRIIFSGNLQQELAIAISECEHDRLFVLVDDTTRQTCWPLVASYPCLRGASLVCIPANDTHKTLKSLTHVWQSLQSGGATRHSCLVNLGGGMVTDLGGFAASTFKRGINFINIPTTLLAMVDASVGGKTGINFGGLKNEIGVFSQAEAVILDTRFLQTLDAGNIRSGYAEMLKHALIADEPMWADILRQGLRKALNLGHTFGHAFESWSLRQTAADGQQTLLHGYAVAYGLICELYLSAVKTGFPVDKMRQTVRFIREHYGLMAITCDDYPALIELMTHDKKNTSAAINFTLLGGIGDIRINQTASEEEIKEALDFYREG